MSRGGRGADGAGGARRRAPMARAAILAASVAGVGVLAAPAAPTWAGGVVRTAPPAPPAPPAPHREPIDDLDVKPLDTAGIDPVLDGVEVEETPEIRQADDRYERVAKDEGHDVLRWLAADRVRAGLIARATSAAATVDQDQRVVAQAQAQVDAERRVRADLRAAERVRRAALQVQQDELRALAAAVLASVPTDENAFLANYDDFTASDRRKMVREGAIARQSRRVDAKRGPWERARAVRRTQDRKVASAVRARKAAQARLDQAIKERDDFGALLIQANQKVDQQLLQLEVAKRHTHEAVVLRRAARVTSYVKDQDLPLAALDAYWRASGRSPCFVPWWVLAGVGRVETRHGTAQGSELQPDGTTSKHILGPVLDGSSGAAVPDTDGGLLDDDPRWERAVGPMQFLPGTWGRWAMDGNADQKADPHNIYDAAWAAANYLCFRHVDLTDDASIRLALLTYNRSDFYVSEVRRFGDGYRRALSLPDARGVIPDADVDPNAATTTTAPRPGG